MRAAEIRARKAEDDAARNARDEQALTALNTLYRAKHTGLRVFFGVLIVAALVAPSWLIELPLWVPPASGFVLALALAGFTFVLPRLFRRSLFDAERALVAEVPFEVIGYFELLGVPCRQEQATHAVVAFAGSPPPEDVRADVATLLEADVAADAHGWMLSVNVWDRSMTPDVDRLKFMRKALTQVLPLVHADHPIVSVSWA